MARIPRRRVALAPVDFEEAGVEAEGLPAGVQIRWFRSLIARTAVDGARAGQRVPDGAIVWSDAPQAFPEAAAVAAVSSPEDGPHALPAAGEGAADAPTVREAVAEALAALPEALRASAGEEVEIALAAAGL